jgi:ATP-binding cassette subfamily C (CFTR/MRP) protein 1
VVLLDEATGSVDRATEAVMSGVMREGFAGRTVLAVAHRGESVMDFERVVVMEGGRVVEVGVPGELMRVEESRFRALVEGAGGGQRG